VLDVLVAEPRLQGALSWPAFALNEVTPLSSQATASPSMMQERKRRRAKVSTIRGKR
jgi:hypothetical protein